MPVLLLPPLVICGDTDFLCKKERVLVGGVIYTAQHFKSFLSSFGVLPHRCTLANTPIHEHALPRCTCREGQRLHYAAVGACSSLNITTIANAVIYFFHHFASPPFFFLQKKGTRIFTTTSRRSTDHVRGRVDDRLVLFAAWRWGARQLVSIHKHYIYSSMSRSFRGTS